MSRIEEIYKCLIVAGIGYCSILFINTTYSHFIRRRRFQLLPDGSLESPDHTEGEDANDDSTHDQLLVKVSPNSVDQAKGEDADDDSTYVQDKKNHTTRTCNGYARGRDLMSEVEENIQDKKNHTIRTCNGYARGRDWMSEIEENIQKTRSIIEAGGGRVTFDMDFSQENVKTLDKKNHTMRTCNGYARGRDWMSEIEENIQKTRYRIHNGGGRITSVWDSCN